MGAIWLSSIKPYCLYVLSCKLALSGAVCLEIFSTRSRNIDGISATVSCGFCSETVQFKGDAIFSSIAGQGWNFGRNKTEGVTNLSCLDPLDTKCLDPRHQLRHCSYEYTITMSLEEKHFLQIFGGSK